MDFIVEDKQEAKPNIFKVGMRVRAVKSCDGNSTLIGQSGTIRKITSSRTSIGVEFDKWSNGNSLGDLLTGNKRENGWHCEPDSLIPLSNKIEEIKRSLLK